MNHIRTTRNRVILTFSIRRIITNPVESRQCRWSTAEMGSRLVLHQLKYSPGDQRVEVPLDLHGDGLWGAQTRLHVRGR